MPWKETAPGRYERPFDSMEQFYRSLSAASAPMNRDNCAITAVIRLRLGPTIGDAESALRHAWKTLRHDFPQIAAYGQGNTYIYENLSPSDPSLLETWLKDSFIVEPATFSTAELHRETIPAMYAKMHYFPHTSELAFRSPHWRIDGIGTLHLLNSFLTLLAHPRPITFGNESHNLSTPLTEAAAIPATPTPEAQQEATALLTAHAAHLPSLGLPTSTAHIPTTSARCTRTFSKHRTAALVAACKAQHFTVTTATHAAVVAAIALSTPAPCHPANHYTAWSTFDLRRYCRAPFSGAGNAVSVFHTGLLGVVKPSSFAENARQLREVYRQDPSRVFAFLPFYLDEVMALYARLSSEGGAVPACEPQLSSLGIVDGVLGGGGGEGEGGVGVEGFWMGVEVLLRQVVVFVWTWRGEMVLSACFNEAFYSRGFVGGFLEDVERVLVEGLGI